MKHHVIYIPGLADHSIRQYGQAFLIKLWRARYKIGASYLPINWAGDTEAFDAKLQRVVAHIDDLTTQGLTVSLVSSSAGASMAIHAFALRTARVHRVVVVSAALGSARTVSPHVFQRNPAFRISMETLPTAVSALTTSDKQRILSVKPLSDHVVRPEYMDIPGIHYIIQPTHGHAWTIIASLTKYSKTIIDFIVKR